MSITATSGNVLGAIAAGSLTASYIASNAITTDKLNASAVTAAKIAAGTITADKLNVSSLSAISANIGSVTTGSLSGVSISVAGGLVLLDSNGLTLASGAGTANVIDWTGGGYIKHNSNIMSLFSSTAVALEVTGRGVTLDTSNAFFPYGGSVSLGTSGSQWSGVWSSDVTVTSLAGGGTRNIGVNNDGKIIAV